MVSYKLKILCVSHCLGLRLKFGWIIYKCFQESLLLYFLKSLSVFLTYLFSFFQWFFLKYALCFTVKIHNWNKTFFSPKWLPKPPQRPLQHFNISVWEREGEISVSLTEGIGLFTVLREMYTHAGQFPILSWLKASPTYRSFSLQTCSKAELYGPLQLSTVQSQPGTL